jgi:Tfp pilus tip-associated adhesin PilY1
MKEGTHYVFVEKPSSDFYSVKLLTGQWAGVIYTYGTVNIREDKENDVVVLQFQYKIEEKPEEFNSNDLMENSSFKNYIGSILSCILEENEFKIGKK